MINGKITIETKLHEPSVCVVEWLGKERGYLSRTVLVEKLPEVLAELIEIVKNQKFEEELINE